MEKTSMLLHVENAEYSDATVPVRWCVPRSTLQILHNRDSLKQALVFISIVHVESRHEVDRRIFRLQEAVGFIQFRRAGQHRLQAVVFVPHPGDEFLSRTKDVLLTRAGDEYNFRHSILSAGTKSFDRDSFEYVIFDAYRHNKPSKVVGVVGDIGELDITVGSEFFAKPPNGLFAKWVNWGFRKPTDECAYRRRVLWAILGKPIFAPIWGAMKVFWRLLYAFCYLLFGEWGRINSWIKLFRPFRYSLEEALDREGEWFDYQNPFCDEKNYWKRAFIPIAFIVEVGTLLLLYIGLRQVIPQGSLWTLVVLAVVITVAIFGIKWFPRRFNSEERRRRRTDRLDRGKKKMLQECELTLVCTGEKLPTALEALPKNRRTFKLRHLSLKKRVCKPYART